MPEGESIRTDRAAVENALARVEAEKAGIQAERARVQREKARVQSQREEDKVHFLDYWRVVKKRKEIIIAILVIVVAATVVYSKIAKETFSASCQIQVTQWQRPMDPFSSERARYLPFDQFEFETHRMLLESRPVLEKVVTGEIKSDSSFWICPKGHRFDDQKAQRESYVCPTCGDTLSEAWEKKYKDWVPLNKKWASLNNAPGPYSIPATVGALKRRLRIRPEKGTRLITIRYESHDPQEARQITDMVAESYIQLRDERNDARLNEAFDDLKRQVHIYRYGGGEAAGLNQEQAEMIRMKSKLDLDSNDLLIPYQEKTKWSNTREETRAKIAELEAEINELSNKTEDELLNAIQGNSTIATLLVQLAQYEAALDRQLATYGEQHPEILGQKRQIETTKKKLREQANGYLDAKRAELAKLKAYETELERILGTFNEKINETEDAYSKYLLKKGTVEMRTALLQLMEQSQIQKRITNAIPTEDIQIVQRAQTPTSPVSPKPLFNAIVSLFVGLTLGTGIAYFVEYLDTSTKSVDEIERYLELSTLAVIPRQKSGLLIHESPKSHVAENYRMLWTNILFARKQHRFNKMMITSGGAGEGKTTTVVNLGIAAAQMGTKILLVDSDLRRPKIHKLLKYSNKVGLSDVLLKDVSPSEVIVATEVENLWAMPSGRLPKNIIGLLNSEKMREVIARLEGDYDVILFDSPPVMGVSDASVMADLMDRVLLVVDYKNPKRLARNAKRHLENAGGTLIGAVINNLNIQRGDYYYYGYYGYGYGKGYHYYYSARHDEEEEESEEEEPVAVATAPEDQGAGSGSDSQETT